MNLHFLWRKMTLMLHTWALNKFRWCITRRWNSLLNKEFKQFLKCYFTHVRWPMFGRSVCHRFKNTRIQCATGLRTPSKNVVFYGQEPPSGEFTKTKYGVNYKLLSVNYWSITQCGTNSCSRPQQATDNSVRDCRSNWLVILPPPNTGQYPLSSTYCTVQCGVQITRLAATSEDRTRDLRNACPTHCLFGHSGYEHSYDEHTNQHNLSCSH